AGVMREVTEDALEDERLGEPARPLFASEEDLAHPPAREQPHELVATDLYGLHAARLLPSAPPKTRKMGPEVPRAGGRALPARQLSWNENFTAVWMSGCTVTPR